MTSSLRMRVVEAGARAVRQLVFDILMNEFGMDDQDPDDQEWGTEHADDWMEHWFATGADKQLNDMLDVLANGERMASYRDTDGFVKLHGSTMLDERGPGVDYLVVPVDRNLDSDGQTQVSESKLAVTKGSLPCGPRRERTRRDNELA